MFAGRFFVRAAVTVVVARLQRQTAAVELTGIVALQRDYGLRHLPTLFDGRVFVQDGPEDPLQNRVRYVAVHLVFFRGRDQHHLFAERDVFLFTRLPSRFAVIERRGLAQRALQFLFDFPLLFDNGFAKTVRGQTANGVRYQIVDDVFLFKFVFQILHDRFGLRIRAGRLVVTAVPRSLLRL